MSTMADTLLYERCRAHRGKIGAPWFDAAWDLNLLVARSGKVGAWDDLVIVACTDDASRRVVLLCRATGDAWEGEWTAPSHADGCIYTLDQHVPQGLEVGEHKGRPALRQRAPFRYVRWPAGQGRVPTVAELESRAASGLAFTDVRGTHIHNRVSDNAPDKPAPNDSEGCTVNLYQHEHAALMELVATQQRRHGSAKVSVTFCKLSDLGL